MNLALGGGGRTTGKLQRAVQSIALTGGLAPHLERWLAADVQRLLSPAQGDALDGALTLARREAATPKC